MERLAAGERKPGAGLGADRAVAANRPLAEVDVGLVPDGSTVTTTKNRLQRHGWFPGKRAWKDLNLKRALHDEKAFIGARMLVPRNDYRPDGGLPALTAN